MLTHRALLANIAQCLALEPGTRCAPTTSYSSCCRSSTSTGSTPGLGMVAATRRARRCWSSGSTPARPLDVVAAEGVTNIPGAPPMYVAWAALPDGDLGAALRGVRLLASGAAPLPAAVLEQLATETGITVYEGYGLTETAPVVTSTLASPRVKPGSVGRPIPGVEVRLVDEPGRADLRRRRHRRDRGARRQPVLGLLAGRLAAARTPTAGGRPATSPTPTTTATSSSSTAASSWCWSAASTSTRARSRTSIAEHPEVAEVAVIAVPHPHTGEAVKAYVVARAGPTLTAGRRHRRTAPPGWPGSSGRRSSTSWRSCRTRRPARSPRAGCGRLAPLTPDEGSVSEPPGGTPGDADRQAGLPPVRRGPRGRRPGDRRAGRELHRAEHRSTTPTCTLATGSRSRSRSSTASRTTSGGFPRTGCAPRCTA